MKWVVVAAWFVGACSGGGGKSVQVPAPEDFAGAYQDAYCRYAERCELWPSYEACAGANLFVPHDGGIYDAAQAVAAGTATWHADAASACVAAILNTSCDVTDVSQRRTPDACLQMVSGTVGDGQTAHELAACVSQRTENTTCTSAGCCTYECFGDLAPRIAQVDETCGAALGCVAGAWCPQQGGFPDLLDAVCTPLAGEGEDCSLGGSAQCAYGLACMDDRRCGAPKALGAACAGVDVCRDASAGCDGTRCVRLQRVGDPCDQFCGPYACDATAHTCVAGVPSGQPCQNPNDLCEDPSESCNTSTNACAPRVPNGAHCFANQDCESDFCTSLNSCAAKPACSG